MTLMSKLSAEERDEQLSLVTGLIDEGRITSWTDLGKVLGISRQAAQARFGPDGYGLQMPERKGSPIDHRIYLGLDENLKARYEQLPADTRQTWVRRLLDQHLPRVSA